MPDENENVVSTQRLNFGATETAQVTEAPAEVTQEQEEEFTPPAFLNKSTFSNNTEYDEVEEMNEEADLVAVDATVDGSQADLVQEVEKELTVHTGEADVAPETIRQEAPQAVAEEVADNVEGVQATAPVSDGVAAGMAGTGSIDELRAKQDEINRQIEEQKASQKQAVLDQIKNVVTTYGLTAQEVVDALGGLKKTRVGSKAKPKYRNPADGKEWSGRGKEPLWIKGQIRDQFLIV